MIGPYDIEDFDAFDDNAGGECWHCGGDGGRPVCAEDCCPHIYGEEGCDDPACWVPCETCDGTGEV